MRNRIVFTAMLVAAISAAGLLMHTSQTTPGLSISPAYAAPDVTAREAFLGGRQVGEVLVDGQVVFRIRTSAGGFSPYRRAEIVAGRLQQMMGDSLQPEDITMGRVNGQEVVLADGELIVTADQPHARINNSTPSQLANLWAQQLRNAVGGQPVVETPVAQKVVPIISVGTGTRVGGALVTGSTTQLEEVNAVAQVEDNMGNSVNVRVLIPVATEDVVQQVERVPQTSVIGLVDIRL